MARKMARPYTSPTRERQAVDTRRRIVEAAQGLLQSKGYAGMTVDAIAQQAGVASQTVYAIFRSKIGILAELLDQASYGPDYRELVRQAFESQAPAARLGFAARIARTIYDTQSSTLDLLRGAGVIIPDLARLLKERESKRYEAQHEMISGLEQMGALRRGLDPQSARDVFWTLTSREIYRMLVLEREWTSQAYEDWLRATLIVALLKPQSAGEKVPKPRDPR